MSTGSEELAVAVNISKLLADQSRFEKSSQGLSLTTRAPTEFDIFKSPSGLEHHIRNVSQLAWIGVGEAEWRLSLFGAGHILLKQHESGLFSATFVERATSWTDSDRSSGDHTYKFDDIRTLEDQATQFIRKSSSPAVDFYVNAEREVVRAQLRLSAVWRELPATEAQVSFAGRMIGTSYQIGANKSWKHIPGGWIGRDWDEQIPAKHMAQGEVHYTLERVMRGMEELSEKFKAQGMICPRRKWFGAEEECDAALEQSTDLEKALRRYYFA